MKGDKSGAKEPGLIRLEFSVFTPRGKPLKLYLVGEPGQFSGWARSLLSEVRAQARAASLPVPPDHSDPRA